MRLILPLALLAAAGLSGCDRPAGDGAADNAAVSNIAVENHATGEAVAPAQANALGRLGPIRIGATIADLTREGLTVAGRDEPMPGSTCSYASFEGWPDVGAMLDGERVVRIDISGKQHEGPHGLRAGQSEAEALERLGSARVEPHPYTGPQGHYLIAHEDGAPLGLIAETDGKTVQSWRIGQWEQVQWVETCF